MENLFLQAIGEIRSEIGKVLAARDYDFYRRNLNCESRDPGADPRRVNKTSYNFKPITSPLQLKLQTLQYQWKRKRRDKSTNVVYLELHMVLYP